MVPDELQGGYPVAVEAALDLPWAIHVPQHSVQEKLLPMKKLLLVHHLGLLERLPKASSALVPVQAISQEASWATNPLLDLPHLASALSELWRHRPELG